MASLRLEAARIFSSGIGAGPQQIAAQPGKNHLSSALSGGAPNPPAV